MNEAFLQYIWEQKLLKKGDLKAEGGEKLEIIHPGTKNENAGPDFLNARIKIHKTVWAGNVEIHQKASDWYKHNHHNDKAYNNVILHVVTNFDKEIFRDSGEQIPTLLLKYSQRYAETYERLQKNKNWVACEHAIHLIDPFIINFWLQSLVIERLTQKTEYIRHILVKNNNCWEETFYQLIAKNFGFKLNALPFEILANNTALKHLSKHRDHLNQVEAILYGQAGFLDQDDLFEDYFNDLKREYLLLKKKFSLTSIQQHLWKFAKSRPANFPTIRIAQFAKLMNSTTNLFSQVIECKNIQDIKAVFEVSASSFWDTHYHFNKVSTNRPKTLGEESIKNILINTVIPFIFLYGKEKDNEVYKDKAVIFLEQLSPESNSIISKWNKSGIVSQNAADSQALIQLKNTYCNQKKCLNCQIGSNIIKNGCKR